MTLFSLKLAEVSRSIRFRLDLGARCCGGAVKPLEDAVASCCHRLLMVTFPGGDEIASVRQPHSDSAGVGGGLIQLNGAVHLVAVGGRTLGINPVAAVVGLLLPSQETTKPPLAREVTCGQIAVAGIVVAGADCKIRHLSRRPGGV